MLFGVFMHCSWLVQGNSALSANQIHSNGPNINYKRFKRVISQAVTCIKSAAFYKGHENQTYHYPDDAEAHWVELKSIYKKYETSFVLNWNGYGGPWMENVFNKHFGDKPITYFRGIFPIFIQWLDLQVASGSRKLYNEMIADFDRVLRPDCLYLAVTYEDSGIWALLPKHPNVLILSGGGNGHIPIPEIKGMCCVICS